MPLPLLKRLSTVTDEERLDQPPHTLALPAGPELIAVSAAAPAVHAVAQIRTGIHALRITAAVSFSS